MPIYVEKPDKLSLKLTSSSNLVTLTMNTYHGTESALSWIFNDFDVQAKKGIPIKIGRADQLKGVTLYFDGASNNPSGAQIKIEYILAEKNGNSLTYIFPNDYEGEVAFDWDNAHPANAFQVNFC